MKRFTMIMALVLMVTMPTFADRVTSETAQKVAATFLNNNGAKTNQLTDLSKEAGFKNLYIFNGNPGFVVMAADDCVQPILGYSLTDEFDAKDMPENLRWWLQGYSDEIQSAINNKMRASSETSKMWKELVEGNAKAGKATVTVAPLIQTKWNQNKYYNRLCPASDGPDGYAYTGCVATAMAQVMKYWEYPAHGISSHSYIWNGQTLNADFGATNYEWNNMADTYDYYYVNGTDQYAVSAPSHSDAEIAAVATLMYHCGVSVEMNYGGDSVGGSSASNADAATALKTYFNYSPATEYKQKTRTDLQTQQVTINYTDSQWIAMLKAELDAQRPLQYGGQDPNGNSGHAFVCDGYDNANYFHFNWGWAGHYNGYFSINNLDTGANSGEAGAGNGVYTRDQNAIFGIQPVQCAAEEPSNLTYALNGFNVMLNWTAGEGASSYNIYRNNVLVGNTTGTTYTDNINYGTYSYYVKSKDANGSQSLPSNTIVVSIAPVPTNLTATLNGNNVDLIWAEPEWSAPQTGDEMLTYGTGDISRRFGVSDARGYYGHRYPVSMLSFNKILYKVSFYTTVTGDFAVYVYSAASGNTKPQNLLCTKSITASAMGWCDIEFDAEECIHIDNTKDLWVFIYDPEGKQYPMGVEDSNNDDGSYYSAQEVNGPTSWVESASGRTMLIRTYITDDSFRYNLYDNNTLLATNLSGTTYTVSSVSNNTAHQYTLKTNFNGGLTEASNIAGLTIGEASLASLNLSANDMMTITEDSKLTVSGTLSDVNANNLVLEDGAQLVNDSEGVKATVKKAIQPYTDGKNDGWNLIASPITENLNAAVDVNGLVRGDYDLYIFDQAGIDGKEWRNYEEQAFTTIDNKVGYLYSNSNETMISFAGTLAGTAGPTTITRDNTVEFPGFNLIGNPYPCEVYTNKPFYTLQYDAVEDKTFFDVGNNPIPPCSAILVQAQTAEESVSFSKTPIAKQASITMKLSKSNTRSAHHIDQARISFEADYKLSKYTWDDASSTIYIPQNGQNFAVAYANGANAMPINIHVVQNGTYTISFEEINLNLNYLHLIDNLSGNEVDLLTTPNYTFEAKTTDYASRFKLVFSICEDANNGNDSFVFASNGQLHILNKGVAQLQIVDITGRILSTETIHGSCSKALNLSDGIYIVRLIQGSETKTQKVVVR